MLPSTEAEMIDALNAVRPDWREYYDSIEEAYDELIAAGGTGGTHPEDAGLDFGSLSFDGDGSVDDDYWDA